MGLFSDYSYDIYEINKNLKKISEKDFHCPNCAECKAAEEKKAVEFHHRMMMETPTEDRVVFEVDGVSSNQPGVGYRKVKYYDLHILENHFKNTKKTVFDFEFYPDSELVEEVKRYKEEYDER